MEIILTTIMILSSIIGVSQSVNGGGNTIYVTTTNGGVWKTASF